MSIEVKALREVVVGLFCIVLASLGIDLLNRTSNMLVALGILIILAEAFCIVKYVKYFYFNKRREKID